MKRTIGICLFAAVMLLVGGLCGKTAFDAGRIRTAEETEAVTGRCRSGTDGADCGEHADPENLPLSAPHG